MSEFVAMTLIKSSLTFLCLLLVVATAKAEDKIDLNEAKATIEAAGIKVGSAFTLPEEAEFTKLSKDLIGHKRTLFAAEKELAAAEDELSKIKQTVTVLKAKHVEMSAALAGPVDIRTNNQIVGALNATRGQIDLLIDQQEKTTDKIKTARAKASDAREAYMQHVMGMRVVADKITQKWEKLSSDSDLVKLVADVNTATGKKFALKASPAFVTAEKQLQAVEEKVLIESIPLRDEGRTMYVSVVINGKHTKEMVLDSGANTISLPYKMAIELGLEPTSSDTKVQVSIADGSTVSGTLKTIPKVRVGKFSVDNVECIILGPEAINAPPLLGMSFLGHFQFEINQAKSELKMVKIDTDEKKK